MRCAGQSSCRKAWIRSSLFSSLASDKVNRVKIGVYLLAGLLAALIFSGGCGKSKTTYSAIPAGSVVLAFGDSVTHGTGAGANEDFPTQLERLSGWRMENYGVPGDTSAGALGRIEAALRETRPAMVIVEIGGNDFLRRVSDEAVKENVRSILQRIRQFGSIPVLVATPSFSPLGAAIGKLPDAELYAQLAKEESVLLIPDIFAEVLSDSKLKSDYIHPNAIGYRKMAEGIAAELAQAGLLKPR